MPTRTPLAGALGISLGLLLGLLPAAGPASAAPAEPHRHAGGAAPT